MSGQGKYDALTKELITHILGFKEGEENFVRSEQFVLSNLLYHHCLAVNSHAVRRSIDGLVLKFTIHGQHHRANSLKTLTQKFLASPLFKNHYETDLEWSLLSLLLHLSNSPTQVPLSEAEVQSTTTTHHHHTPIHEETHHNEEVDWTAHLREDDPTYVLGPEEPLSDWSDDECDEFPEERQTTRSPPPTCTSTLPEPVSAPLPITTKTCSSHVPRSTMVCQDHTTLAHLHKAKEWLADKTHAHYWVAEQYNELPSSNHPMANVAELCANASSAYGGCQQLSEWTVMREVVWCLMCPVSSHIFNKDKDNNFSVRQAITLSSTTPDATRNMLQYLCVPLMQLHTLDTFLHTHSTPCLHPPTPVTLLAYTAGLRHWRHTLTQHLKELEDNIKEQEAVCTLLWLEGELMPWIRTLNVLFTLHMKANTVLPNINPATHAMRLLGCVCECLESVGDSMVRGVVLRLLLHTLRSYLSIMHTWLMRGTLLDHTHEFIILRDESVTVYDERFWHKAFTVNLEDTDIDPNTQSDNPVKVILKILSPLLSVLISVGKSQELLAALGMPSLPLHTHTNSLAECSLEEVVVRYIRDTVCNPREKETNTEKEEDENSELRSEYQKNSEEQQKKEEKNEGDSEKQHKANGENIKYQIKTSETCHDSEEEGFNFERNNEEQRNEKDNNQRNNDSKSLEERSAGKIVGESAKSNARVVSSVVPLDPLLMAAYTETLDSDITLQQTHHNDLDIIASLIEGIGNISDSISVTLLLTSALQPLMKKRQEEVSSKLSEALLHHHHLALHCQALSSVMLMEAGDIMHEFYSHLFDKVESGNEGVDSLSLTLHLQYCVSRLYPDLAQHFSVTIPLHNDTQHRHADDTLLQDATHSSNMVLLIDEQRPNKDRLKDGKNLENLTSSNVSFTQDGIPELQINYQAPWPANLLLTEQVMKQYNRLFNFSLSLKRVTNGLERLKFKELSSWNLIKGHDDNNDADDENNSRNTATTPLLSRIHRIQLLRQWLLFFSRELHDHFANTAFLPFYQAIERVFQESPPPPFNTIITEHERLLHKLASECLVGDDQKIVPLQIVLKKVFWLVHRVCVLWEGDVSSVNEEEITDLETHYALIHRYLVNFLTTIVSRAFTPHLEGLTRTLVDTVPLLTHLNL